MSNLCPLIYTGFVPKDLVVENATVTKVLVACNRAVVEAKEWEVQFLSLVTNLKDDRTDAIKTVNSLMATKMVGNRGKIYKAIKAQLKTDTALNGRYESIVVGMKAEQVKAD